MSGENGARRRAVITGLGPITPIGIGREAFWEGLLAGRSGVGRLTRFDPSFCKAPNAAEITGWDPSRFFPPHRLKRLDRFAQFSVASALLALEDAGFGHSPERPNPRAGVSFGTALGGIAHAENEHAAFMGGGLKGVHQTLALQVFGGSGHSNIAIECGFRGVGTTNSNSCASGVVAVGEALRYIRDGMADLMVAGGAEAPLCPLTFGAFDVIRTMSRFSGEPAGLACRPFDAERDGFVMGEGAASLVIEEMGHAERRGARVYAEVLGFGISNEAYHMTTPLPSGEAVAACMRAALDDAGIPPERVDYINAHASSTRVNDSNETACVKAVFGDHARRLKISGTKPFTGHPLGATGAIEAAICALAIDRGYIPPTLNRHTPDPDCDLDVVPCEGRHEPVGVAMNNAFGFGGINATVILGRV